MSQDYKHLSAELTRLRQELDSLREQSSKKYVNTKYY